MQHCQSHNLFKTHGSLYSPENISEAPTIIIDSFTFNKFVRNKNEQRLYKNTELAEEMVNTHFNSRFAEQKLNHGDMGPLDEIDHPDIGQSSSSEEEDSEAEVEKQLDEMKAKKQKKEKLA